MTHELKTWPVPFRGVDEGRKHHEIRSNDRGFKVGDILVLREWDPDEDPNSHDRPIGYTGRSIRCLVSYLSAGGTWGLPDGLCVMSIEVLE